MSKILGMSQPASKWEEGYPIGNGQLGAMVMGTVQTEQLFLNEESMWFGGDKDAHNEDTLIHLTEIRQLLFDGKIQEATRLAKYAMTSTPKYMNPYQPLGRMDINFSNMPGEVTGYERRLDLSEAVTWVRFQKGNTYYTREYLASDQDQVIAMRLTAKGENKLNFDLNLNRRPFDLETGRENDTTIYMKGQNGPDGIYCYTAVSAKSEDGIVKAIGDFITVQDATCVELYLTTSTSFKCENYEEKALGDVEQATQKGYDVIKREHIEAYQTLYNRNSVSIGEDKAYQDTDSIIKDAMEGKNKESLVELFYNYGRYLLIASSMGGHLPANLQGLWNNSFMPAWECNYTININTEMNYWPAYVSNLEECTKPLIELIKRLCENGKETAKRLYGCEGSVAHHVTNMWAHTTPGGIFNASPFWPMGLAWMSLHLVEHYNYTQDIDFVKNECIPVLEEIIKFYRDYLVETKEGYLVTGPSLSPENTYIHENGQQGALCMGPSMDSQIIRQICLEYQKMVGDLAIDSSLQEDVARILDKLPPTQLGKHGQIMEWYKDYDEAEPGHRHMSHVFAIHPGNQITKDKTPELFEGIKKTLERRLAHGGGHTSWSMAWIVNLYARLFEGEEAYQKLMKLVTQQVCCNLFTLHPPFQIDGNFGGCAAISEMLIQSHEDFIRILPAIPSEWDKGEAKGFCARGGIEVSFKWENHQVVWMSLKSRIDTQCSVRLPQVEDLVHFNLAKGEVCVWDNNK